MVRSGFASVLVCCAAALAPLACSAFQGSDGATTTDAATDAPTADAGPGDPDPLDASVTDSATSMDAGPPNLLPPIQDDGSGGCLKWFAYNSTMRFYDGGNGEGVCVLCFLGADAGTGTPQKESYVEWNHPEDHGVDAGTIFTGSVLMQTPPAAADAGPVAPDVRLNLYAPDPTSPSMYAQVSSGKTAPTVPGAVATTSLTITAAMAEAGVGQIQFRIDGDHGHDACVAIRRPNLTAK